MLKNKPHWVTLHKGILVSLRTFQLSYTSLTIFLSMMIFSLLSFIFYLLIYQFILTFFLSFFLSIYIHIYTDTNGLKLK